MVFYYFISIIMVFYFYFIILFYFYFFISIFITIVNTIVTEIDRVKAFFYFIF